MDPLYSGRGTQFFVITSGAKIVGPTESRMSNGKPVDWCSGFIVDADCTATIIGKDGDSSASVPLALLKGVPYHFAVRYIAVSGGANIVGWI